MFLISTTTEHFPGNYWTSLWHRYVCVFDAGVRRKRATFDRDERVKLGHENRKQRRQNVRVTVNHDRRMAHKGSEWMLESRHRE